MLVLFLCKRTCIDHFQEHVIRYVYMFKDPDPVFDFGAGDWNWTWGLRALADCAVLL